MIPTMKSCSSRSRGRSHAEVTAMNHSFLRRMALLAAISFCCLAGCAEEEPETVRIGVALYQQDDTFLSTIVQNLEQQAKERETADRKLNLNIADGRGSQAAQNEQIERFLKQGYDVVCVNIVDRTAAAVLIDKARASNVPLIFFNREPVEEDLMRWDKVFYVGSDAEQSGLLQGGIVRDVWKADRGLIDRNGDGLLQYVMLEGEPGHQDTLLRTENSIKALTKAWVPVEKLANDSANWQRGQAHTRMAQWLKRIGQQVEVVFANNDDMALGAIDACFEAGMSEDQLPFVVGVDATPPALEAIAEGTLKGTVRNNASAQASAMLDLACALSAGEGLNGIEGLKNGKYIRTEYAVVTPENLDEFLP